MSKATRQDWALPNVLGAELDKARAMQRDREAARVANKKPQMFFGRPVGPGRAGTGYGSRASPGRSLVGRGR